MPELQTVKELREIQDQLDAIAAELAVLTGNLDFEPVPFAWVANAGAQFDIADAYIVAAAKYRVLAVSWAADDDGSAATEVTLHVGFMAGYTPDNSAGEFYTSETKALPAGVYDLNLVEAPIVVDGNAKLYGYPDPDGGTTNGAGYLWMIRVG